MPKSEPQTERRFLPSQLRAESAGEASYLSGYAATFNVEADLGFFFERLMPGCFSRALKEGQDVRCLVDHDSSKILGRTKSKTLQLSEDSKGLRFKVQLPDTAAAKDLKISIQRADVDSCSFAMVVKEEAWVTENGRDGSPRMVREVRDVDLYDVSCVTFPAYSNTSVNLERSLWPQGMPAEVRAHTRAGSPAMDDTDDQECQCACDECGAGDHEECSNTRCQDERCAASGCPAQSGDDRAAANARKLAIAEAAL